jgi:hypothetical protein
MKLPKELANVKTELTWLEPDDARKHVEKTRAAIEDAKFRQRSTSEKRIHKYARSILRGTFLATPQTIAISTEGYVIDGLHRLEAIIVSGRGAWVNLSTGWPRHQEAGIGKMNTIDGIDRGKPRTVGNQLQVAHGYASAKTFAAISKCIAEICADAKHVDIEAYDADMILEIYKPSAEVIMEIAGGNTGKHVSYIMGPLAFAFYSNPDKTREFAQKLYSLEGLTSGHPALALVKWLQSHDRTKSQDRNDTAKVILACLKAFIEGRKLTKCYVSQDAWLWATAQQKENVRKVRQIVGIK